MDQWNRKEKNAKTEPHIHSQLIVNKGTRVISIWCKGISGEKEIVLSTNSTKTIRHPYQNMNLDPYIATYTKLTKKMDGAQTKTKTVTTQTP